MPNNIRHTPLSQVCASPRTSGSRGLARLHAVAAAVLLCTSLSVTGEAHALALGRIVVQSALGEPLRAEIDVPEITAEEAASLRVGVAPVDAFRAAGMEINPALGELQVSLQRRPDGRQYLRLTSPRPVSEPFMDMILEANWASGRIVRDYTLLFDPPNLRQAAAAPLAPGVSAPAATSPAAPAAVQAPTRPAPAPVASTTPAPRAEAPASRPPRPVQPPRPAPERAAAPAPASAPTPAAAEGSQQQRVRAGETASRIASRNLPANVSLDQMLVAMLRSNPDAFIGGNINRIKAGSVLDMPGQSQANAVPAEEARQVIAAQSRDFNDFRRRLAAKVPTAAVATADRQATGRVQAEVEDKKPAPPTQDKLTLSKGATPAQPAQEDKIAKERQSKEAASRAAELSRNIEELAKLGTSTAAATAAAAPATSTSTAPGLSVPGAAATATAPVSTPTAAVATPTATVAAAPTETAAPAVQTPTAAAPTPAPLPVPEAEEPGFMAQLMENPLVLPAAGGLLALLGGLGIYRLRQRKKGSGVDSSFLESRLQPDSFFGSSGGQRIDTAEAAASGSSMVYSPSQLDAAGDVDPVAEADVYLAYGRDLQAEEILKEAMRSTPTRVAIHNKLLEIYAKRRDAKAFEVVATEAYGLTQGQGPEWEHACELGKELDPSNALYQPGGSPAPKPGAPAGAATVPFGSSTLAQHPRPGSPSLPAEAGDMDLTLDLDLDEPSGHAELAAAAAPSTADMAMSGMDDLNSTEMLTSATAPVVTEDPSGPSSMSMDFDLDFPSEPIALTPAAAPTMAAQASAASDAPTFDDSEVLPDFALDAPPVLTPVTDEAPSFAMPANEPVAPPPADMLAFDLSDINLDLDEKAPAQPTMDAEPSGLGGLTAENPLETKLSLAEEFRAIGDLEGARSLAEEVLAEASGSLKSKASAFLNDLA